MYGRFKDHVNRQLRQIRDRGLYKQERVHRELEERIAAFLGTDEAILYSSAFDANGGVFEPLLDECGAHTPDQIEFAFAKFRKVGRSLGAI